MTLTAVSALNDSTLPFRFEQDYYECTDIGKGAVTCDSRNDVAGDVKTHCPDTCSATATGVYESNMYVDFGIVKGGVTKPKQCRPWLSQEDWSKCTARCANKAGILDTCENSCNTCTLIGMDSDLPFKFQKKYYECKDVSDTGPVTCTSKGAKAGNVAKHCSSTCKDVKGSFDESDMYVDVGIRKKGVPKPKKCEPWLAQKDWSKCVERCNRPEVRLTCPKSCWYCDGLQAI